MAICGIGGMDTGRQSIKNEHRPTPCHQASRNMQKFAKFTQFDKVFIHFLAVLKQF